MKRDSIFFTLGVSFLLSLVLVVISFFVFLKSDYEQNMEYYKHRYISIVKMIKSEYKRKGGINIDFKQNLQTLSFEIIEDKNEIKEIVNRATYIDFYHKRHKPFDFEVLSYNNSFYIYINAPKQNLLIKDIDSTITQNTLFIMAIFGLIIVALMLLAITVFRKLYPLKILKNKVQSLGDENFDFECCNSNAKDEVSLLAMEFKKSALKLKQIKEARNIFIRNIMHELKTPITKGKFLLELEDSKKEDFAKVFNRLESLINEFASIEEIIASKKELEKKEYYLSDLIDNALDISYHDSQDLQIDIEDIKYRVNFKLFSIALKNLIDNAIKYSLNNKATIYNKDKTIYIENYSLPLKKEIDEYFEPFNKENKNSDDGFGLGLYITKNLLIANGYELEYQYKDEKVIFTIREKNDI